MPSSCSNQVTSLELIFQSRLFGLTSCLSISTFPATLIMVLDLGIVIFSFRLAF